jgi:YD repeat-containing protein
LGKSIAKDNLDQVLTAFKQLRWASQKARIKRAALKRAGDWAAHSDAGVSQTRTHAAAHELTGLTTGGTTSPLSYDSKGNLLSRPAALGLVWDFGNRLRGADTNGTPATQEVTFEYDALGRRVARSEAGQQMEAGSASPMALRLISALKTLHPGGQRR